jgi:hypothetical protein
MDDLQTWTLLKQKGHIWFDDEEADITVFLQIVNDLSEPVKLRLPVTEPNAPDMARFQLMSSDKYYLVASSGFKQAATSARLGALIAKQFDGICEVLPG